MYHIHVSVCEGQKRRYWVPGTGTTDDWEPCRGWEPSTGSLQAQPVLLGAEPSLQPFLWLRAEFRSSARAVIHLTTVRRLSSPHA